MGPVGLVLLGGVGALVARRPLKTLVRGATKGVVQLQLEAQRIVEEVKEDFEDVRAEVQETAKKHTTTDA